MSSARVPAARRISAIWIDIAEKGNGPQDIIFRSTEAGAPDGVPGMGISALIRNRVNAKLCQADRHIQTVLPGLAHADDTAGTCTHSFGFDLLSGFRFSYHKCEWCRYSENSAGMFQCYGGSWLPLLHGDGEAVRQ